ncbi:MULTISPECIES: sulfur carrier protein ThiS [Brevibacillus]|uniref:Sulfur carrier protein ThiS n=1 Tax=Brevibacillus invocatus TaxID=173959 RepID=A0A3M8CLF7_9BACL|nr:MULTISPECIES: sulfur carrier protein ThiS [Brevibacillus]MCM3080949.1 sulfur carrier protein ThiS [Brevibacillus invocatus]MCM3431199.1 sulfur carrier protein ThiS [Brevibacillus invocatus]MDH4618447.1 sulfur carrier protein ThiS [Brevibacillus sp. AY1]RNB76560.1 sulfur carrier protein ThiS [Brevibacillus invocatus]
MRITLNGKQVELTEEVQTIRGLLASYQLLEKIVVVEQNGEILDRTKYEEKTIADGDRIEIVHFVGGG